MITVLMAVYNGEKYLREQLDSILSQQGLEKGQLRIIVSDDNSADSSRKIIQEYARHFPEQVFPVFRKTSSGSAQEHFLSLLSQEEDEYIMLSDQDDVWLPEKVELLLRKMREMEERYGKEMPILVHSDMKVADEALETISGSYFRYQKISPERASLPQLLVQNNVTGGATMVNHAMLPFFKQIPSVCLMHDNWMALLAASFGKIGWVDKPLYLYRQHGNNSLGARKADTIEEAAKRVWDGSQAEENYRRMFAQAQCLLQMYEDRLDEEQKEILRAFISLPGQRRLGKIKTMIKYGFTKNSMKRTLGQMLFM
ncbi:glycosyltransferase family 2 protein [Lachnospiraceae bacterium 62-35]